MGAVRGYGRIEISGQELFGFVARALDYGGTVFDYDKPDTLAEALAALEQGLAKWFEEQGIELGGLRFAGGVPGGNLMAGGETQKTNEGHWRQAYGERRFAVLLVILAVLVAGPPVLLGFGLSPAWFDGLMALLLVAAILALCFERRQRLFALLLGIPTVLLSVGGHALPAGASAPVLLAGHLCEVLFLFGAAALIVRALFSARTLTFDSILGAVCGYLFLGLGWAVLY
jgi:hypothetical protein